MGVLHTKIFCAGVLLGPNGRLKRAIEQVIVTHSITEI